MQNKSFVVVLTAIVTLLCIYYLSFTFISRGVQQDAVTYATDESGNVDFFKKQQYLDSVWNVPVFSFLGADYTYKEVKDTELNLGLDLQGGMHVTLEVSPVEIVRGLSGNSKDEAFNAALEDARLRSKTSQTSFVDLFYEAYRERKPDGRLSEIFANAANRGRVSYETSDSDIIAMIDDEVDDAIDRSFNILRTRIDRFGTSQPNIQRLQQGTGRIQVEIPGADNPERVRNLLQGVAKLEFWEVAELQEIGGVLENINALLVEEQRASGGQAPATATTDTATAQETDATITDPQASAPSGDEDTVVVDDDDDLISQLGSGEEGDEDSLFNENVSPFYSLIQSQYGGLIYNIRDTAQINRILAREEVKSLINNVEFKWSQQPLRNDNNRDEQVLELHAIKKGRNARASLEGDVITDARQDLDERSRPAVSMQMNAVGAKKWKKLTGDNIGNRIAIVLDGYVLTAPNVSSEIPNGQSVISGNFSLEEARDLASLLKAGALPAPTRIVEEAMIGPTLGQEAISQGFTSIVAGLALVVLFIVIYYSTGGLVANLALLFNIFFIVGILAQLNAALTLPGIAGIVLTIGMAIDANVLIFERIREELAKGLGLKKAIQEGYNKAFSAIIDSNATTFLTAVILYALGQGPVKGFAITLMIGIVCSLFSAVLITRVIIEYLARKGDDSKLSFSMPFSKNLLTNLNWDFLSKRKIAYIFSGALIGIGMLLMIVQGGLQMGVDFTGGRAYVISFSEPVVPSELKVALGDDFENAGVEVKTYGANNVLRVTTSYLIDEESTDADATVQQALITGISDFTNYTYARNADELPAESFTISGSSKVGASIADDIKTSSQQSVIFALIAIFFYIMLRFRKWQFGLGAVVALFHDTLAVLSAFSIAQFLGLTIEVDQVFIAAMLTVIGYSINDTVVVFDRVREDVGLSPKSNLTALFNGAINNTMSRTLITSMTTLTVVLVLFLFGGEVLRGFSFALLIGILIGTYSSIFIATPIVLDLSKKSLNKQPKVAAAKV